MSGINIRLEHRGQGRQLGREATGRCARGDGDRIAEPVHVAQRRELRHAQPERVQPLALPHAGVVAAHGHAREDASVGAAQPDRPVAAVERRADGFSAREEFGAGMRELHEQTVNGSGGPAANVRSGGMMR